MSEIQLVEGIKYPTNDDNWVKTIAIGAGLEYLSFLIVPLLALLGYYVDVMRRTVAGEPEPPEFEDWGTLVTDGLKAGVILVAYLLVPILAFLTLVVSTVVGGLSSGADIAAILGGVLFGLVVSTLLLVAFMYVGAAGLARFASTGSVAAAFSPSLLSVLVSGAYLKAWVFVLVVSTLSGIVTSVIALIPVVNVTLVVLGPVQVKYVGTVYARYWAQGYAGAMGVETADPSPSASPA